MSAHAHCVFVTCTFLRYATTEKKHAHTLFFERTTSKDAMSDTGDTEEPPSPPTPEEIAKHFKNRTRGGNRRRIVIEYITDKSRRTVTTNKRLPTLLRKATELHKLCGARIALFILGPTHPITGDATAVVHHPGMTNCDPLVSACAALCGVDIAPVHPSVQNSMGILQS